MIFFCVRHIGIESIRIVDPNRRCIMSEKEQKTLCAYVEEELQVKDAKAYIDLIYPASYYCQNCGRSAVKSENVCKPQKLP